MTVETLTTTTDSRERNRLAVTLADADAPGTGAALLGLLGSPHTAGARGTLVYALSCLPVASRPADLAATLRRLLADPAEGFEAKAEADRLLDELGGV